MDLERRNAIRVKKPLTVQYIPDGQPGAKWEISQVRDISENGMYIATDKIFKTGYRLIVRMHIPVKPKESFQLKARVVESRTLSKTVTLTRLAFTEVSESVKELLREYIAWVLVKERGEP